MLLDDEGIEPSTFTLIGAVLTRKLIIHEEENPPSLQCVRLRSESSTDTIRSIKTSCGFSFYTQTRLRQFISSYLGHGGPPGIRTQNRHLMRMMP